MANGGIIAVSPSAYSSPDINLVFVAGGRCEALFSRPSFEWQTSVLCRQSPFSNSAQRNCQEVESVVFMAQINAFYKSEKPKKDACLLMQSQLRKTSHPDPVVKFFNVRHLLRTIDDENEDRNAQGNHDTSDNEKDVILRGPDEDPTMSPLPVEPSGELLVDKLQ